MDRITPKSLTVHQRARVWLVLRILLYNLAVNHRKVDLIEGEAVVLCLFISMIGDNDLALPYRPDQVLDLHDQSVLFVLGISRLEPSKLSKDLHQLHIEATILRYTNLILKRLSEAVTTNPAQNQLRERPSHDLPEIRMSFREGDSPAVPGLTTGEIGVRADLV